MILLFCFVGTSAAATTATTAVSIFGSRAAAAVWAADALFAAFLGFVYVPGSSADNDKNNCNDNQIIHSMFLCFFLAFAAESVFSSQVFIGFLNEMEHNSNHSSNSHAADESSNDVQGSRCGDQGADGVNQVSNGEPVANWRATPPQNHLRSLISEFIAPRAAKQGGV